MTRTFVVIWIAALSLAAAGILALLSGYRETEVQFPRDYASALNVDIVFIGSSLAGNALPATEPTHGILGDDRPFAVLSVNGISEQLSTRLLADAVNSGVETIFVEINAYAHNYTYQAEPVFVSEMAGTMRKAGDRLALKVKTLLNLSKRPNPKAGRNRGPKVLLGVRKGDRNFDPRQLRPIDYYHFHKIKPRYGDELQTQLALARKAKVDVFFFSPPRPQSAVSMIGIDEFADLHSHLNYIAAMYDIPLWYSPTPWPDDHFMDILAHANERGRLRFQEELVQWYEARQ